MSLVERWVATRRGFKPRDVEELIDFYWHRPLAGLLVDAIKSWPITPNQVTLLSALMSLLAGVAMGLGYAEPWWSTAGAALLLWSIVLDCADGQLARVKGISSELGRILDGLADAAAPLAVFHGMAFFLVGRGEPYAWVWPLGWATAISLIWHAGMYDQTKNIYLAAGRPDFDLGGQTLMTSDAMRERLAALRAAGRRLDSWLMRVWLLWNAPLDAKLRPWSGRDHLPENDAERDVFIALYLPVMRRVSWLGFGTHLFLLTLAAAVAPLDHRAIWIAWGIILGPMNVLALWVTLDRPRREARYVETLATMRAGGG